MTSRAFSVRCLQRPRKGPILPPLKMPKPETAVSSAYSSDTFPSPVSLVGEIGAGLRPTYPAGDDSAAILPSLAPKSRRVRGLPPQQQPVIAGVQDQASAGFHQALQQAGERPVVDAFRQHQPPPQVAQVVGGHTQPQPHFVRPETMTGQTRHLHRLFAFFDPLFRSDSRSLEIDPQGAVESELTWLVLFLTLRVPTSGASSAR